MVATRDDGMALHDLIAGTRVIIENKETSNT
jgi:uncharacterized RDD family membrane protein YckC